MTTCPTFGAAKKDATGEPIPFMLDGDPVAFLVPRPIPAIPLMDMAAKANDGDLAGALVGFMTFLEACMDHPEWVRFRKHATEQRLGADDLLPIVKYLVSEGTGRPTMPPLPSPVSSGSAGRLPSPEPSSMVGGPSAL